MFGFIRPVKEELRVREAERFEQMYCALCHMLHDRYGSLQTMFLSYDMVFLALVLGAQQANGQDDDMMPYVRRCPVHPVGGRKCAPSEPALAYAADVSVLLAYHKLCDNMADERGARYAAARMLRRGMTHHYRKACTRLPEVDKDIRTALCALDTLEAARCASLDRPADASARMLTALVPRGLDPTTTRIDTQMFYHLGRWLYLLDAAHDFAEDLQNARYNPIALRFGLTAPEELARVRDALESTLARSLVDVCTAFDLLDVQRDRDLLYNIIFLGLPRVTKQVLDGTYQSKGEKSTHGSL